MHITAPTVHRRPSPTAGRITDKTARAGSSDSEDGGARGGEAKLKRSEQSYFDSYGKIGIHHEMLSDRVRCALPPPHPTRAPCASSSAPRSLARAPPARLLLPPAHASSRRGS